MIDIDDEDSEKALVIIRDKKIFRVKSAPFEMYVVSGSTDEYLVMNEFCSCDHFILRCLKEPGKVCYHILAIRLVKNVDKEIDVDWKDYLIREH